VKHLPQHFFSEDALSDEEIDTLFSQMPCIDPPPKMVENILAAVVKLSLIHKQKHTAHWDTLEIVCMPLDRHELS